MTNINIIEIIITIKIIIINDNKIIIFNIKIIIIEINNKIIVQVIYHFIKCIKIKINLLLIIIYKWINIKNIFIIK